MTLRTFLLFLASCLALRALPPATVLVQSIPAETGLADPALPFAKDVWRDMVRSARTSVDAAEFYITSHAGSTLEPVLTELESAGARGVSLAISFRMLDGVPIKGKRNFRSGAPMNLAEFTKSENP